MISVTIEAIYHDFLVCNCYLSKCNSGSPFGFLKYPNTNTRRWIFSHFTDNVYLPESIYAKYGVFKDE